MPRKPDPRAVASRLPTLAEIGAWRLTDIDYGGRRYEDGTNEIIPANGAAPSPPIGGIPASHQFTMPDQAQLWDGVATPEVKIDNPKPPL